MLEVKNARKEFWFPIPCYLLHLLRGFGRGSEKDRGLTCAPPGWVNWTDRPLHHALPRFLPISSLKSPQTSILVLLSFLGPSPAEQGLCSSGFLLTATYESMISSLKFTLSVCAAESYCLRVTLMIMEISGTLASPS